LLFGREYPTDSDGASDDEALFGKDYADGGDSDGGLDLDVPGIGVGPVRITIPEPPFAKEVASC
jgi:hypothetical protein